MLRLFLPPLRGATGGELVGATCLGSVVVSFWVVGAFLGDRLSTLSGLGEGAAGAGVVTLVVGVWTWTALSVSVS